MSNALLTGVSGLVAHQRMLEVVGNNLANLNTTGFKSQRTLFSDLLYTTLRPATSSSNANFGGINPIQIGSGVNIAQVDRNFSQGNLEPTGSLLDFAIQGDGFFVVNDGSRSLYTRAGAFVLDESGTLVDPTNGYRVLRFGTLGEPDGVNPGFQTPGDAGINIPFGTSIPGEGTTTVELSGNLSANATGPKAEALTSSNPYTDAGSPVTAATLLNDLDSNTTGYGLGDTILIAGTDVDGSPVSGSLIVDPALTTMGDLLAAIDATYTSASASLDASGNLMLMADNTGEAFLSLSLSDDPGNTGATNFSNHASVVTTQGKEGDVVQGAIEVFDVRGGSHTINVTFQKAGDNDWDLSASINPDEGVMIDGTVQQIQFSDDGSLQQVLGTGLGDSTISFQINGISAPQSIQLAFGSSDSFDGLTHLAADSSMAAKQNGFAPGSLVSINMSSDGVIEGVATNGRIFPIAQLAIASFRNAKGLESQGDNFFVESLNSGEVQLGTALSGSRGAINGGRLESSNVDIAFEFTRLIVAQRGFSANARTITVTDEVLEELTNLIR